MKPHWHITAETLASAIAVAIVLAVFAIAVLTVLQHT
jgi:hypothetical protein